MKKFTLLAILMLLRFSDVFSFELQSGDVLLISFNCYECRVIESETNSFFSHSGVIIKNEYNEIRIAQSLGKVALYPLEDFLKNITPGSNVSVFRPAKFLKLNASSFKKLEKNMYDLFQGRFEGAPFDVRYLWDNYDEEGRELLYCSEFIAKFLDYFLDTPTIPYLLTYQKNREYWLQYFQGDIPEGAYGNSPAAFSKDKRFVFLGILDF
jgi:hypothetical protein